MATTPKYKIYDSDGQYQASVKDPVAAAALMALYGTGASVKLKHQQVLWVEGMEDTPAHESYSEAERLILWREEHPDS